MSAANAVMEARAAGIQIRICNLADIDVTSQLQVKMPYKSLHPGERRTTIRSFSTRKLLFGFQDNWIQDEFMASIDCYDP